MNFQDTVSYKYLTVAIDFSECNTPLMGFEMQKCSIMAYTLCGVHIRITSIIYIMIYILTYFIFFKIDFSVSVFINTILIIAFYWISKEHFSYLVHASKVL